MLAESPAILRDRDADDIRSAPLPKRADLMRLPEPEGLVRIPLQIHRNYAFEFVGSVLPPFLWAAGMKPVIDYGAYDNSLSFTHIDPAAIQIISLDFDGYETQADSADFRQWFGSRLETLRDKCEQAIVISNWPSEERSACEFNRAIEKIADRLPAVFVWNVFDVYRRMETNFFDERAVRAKGTRLSDRACIELARSLGLIRLPSALRPRLKAVVVDLDNTLYDGVLGEDGVEGIRITPMHSAIHMELLRLRDEGVFLGVLSKNDESDFAELCLTRHDFLLSADHFSASSVGWHSKVEGLARIADHLRIAPDAILVIDDNPAELEQIRAVHAKTHLLHARDAEQTLFWLRHYPTLNDYRPNAATALRVSDLEASSEREEFRTSHSGADYIREMQIELCYALNPTGLRGRLAELSQKTNQFNTGLQRFLEIQIGKRLQAPGHYTISIGMRDRFSDSGIIGAIFARKKDDSLLIDEICVSCRALGRNVESPMIARALAPIMDRHGLNNVTFTFRQGPRNLPARMWLTSFTGTPNIPDHGMVTVPWEAVPQRTEHLSAPVASKWEHR